MINLIYIISIDFYTDILIIILLLRFFVTKQNGTICTKWPRYSYFYLYNYMCYSFGDFHKTPFKSTSAPFGSSYIIMVDPHYLHKLYSNLVLHYIYANIKKIFFITIFIKNIILLLNYTFQKLLINI